MAPPPPPRSIFALRPRPELAATVTQVESLGVSCELGLVQRRCTAEPLGLFRFGKTPVDGLIAGLESRFEGIGDAALLHLTANRLGEWITTHERYGFEFHTRHNVANFTEAQVRKRMSAHFRLLADKLLDALHDGEKIFVYRPLEPSPASAGGGTDLLAAMHKHGSPVLLWVDLAKDPSQAGTVEWTIPGKLMTGYLDRFAPVRLAAFASFDVWLQIISAALAMTGGSEAGFYTSPL